MDALGVFNHFLERMGWETPTTVVINDKFLVFPVFPCCCFEQEDVCTLLLVANRCEVPNALAILNQIRVAICNGESLPGFDLKRHLTAGELNGNRDFAWLEITASGQEPNEYPNLLQEAAAALMESEWRLVMHKPARRNCGHYQSGDKKFTA